MNVTKFVTGLLGVDRNETAPEGDLVDLATPVLETVMKLRAGLVAPSDDLRRTVDTLLTQMERRGESQGFRERRLQAVKFALASFVDETVLTADFPLRNKWEKNPLQLQYFGEQLAGVKYFERLEKYMKDGGGDVDVVEVYYVCLLLGYKGKYNIYFEEQLKGVVEGVAEYLRRANRLRAVTFSPHWKVTDQPEPASDPGLPVWVKACAGGGLALVALTYVVLNFLLSSYLGQEIPNVLR